jgi:hypothetical protein
VSSNEEEMALFRHEEDKREYSSEVLTIFRKKGGLSPNRSVESSRFDEIQTELAHTRRAFIDAADNEEDRLPAEMLWPYQDSPIT